MFLPGLELKHGKFGGLIVPEGLFLKIIQVLKNECFSSVINLNILFLPFLRLQLHQPHWTKLSLYMFTYGYNLLFSYISFQKNIFLDS